MSMSISLEGNLKHDWNVNELQCSWGGEEGVGCIGRGL